MLVALDGAALRHLDDLQARLADDRIGETVTARVLRGGVLQEVALVVVERG